MKVWHRTTRFQQLLTDNTRSCSSFHNSGCHISRWRTNSRPHNAESNWWWRGGRWEKRMYCIPAFFHPDNLTTWMTDIVTSHDKIIQERLDNVTRSPNNPPPEFFSGAQNPSLHDSILSNAGHLISVNIANHFTPGNFHSLTQLSSENQDLQSALGQVMEEYPARVVPRLLASRIRLSH